MMSGAGEARWVQRGIAALATILMMTAPPVRTASGIPLEKVPAVGNHLPALELTDLQGETHRLEWDSLPQRATIIFFFESQCVDCLREMVFLDLLRRRAKDFGLEVFAVEGSGLTASETGEAMRKYRRFYGDPAFPIVPDPDYGLSSLFGIQRLPSTFLIEKHGVILGREESFRNWTAVDLTRKTERLLKVEKGFFSLVLRELEIDADTEADLEGFLPLRTARAGGGKQAPRRIAVGDPVPAFEYTDIEGLRSEWRPRSGGGGGLSIVFFWGALCRPCIQEMVFLEEVFTSYRDPELQIIAVEGSGLSPERTRSVMERYQRFHPLPSYRIVPDPDYRLAELFGVKGKMPQTFFIAEEGAVVYHTDEFILGHEESLTRKIEMSLKMEPGSLSEKMVQSAERRAASRSASEAPSIGTALQAQREFRSNLVEGDTYYRNWEFDRALPHYLRCLELEPGHATIQLKVAKIYERQGRLEEALEGWEKVLKLDPDNEEALSRIKILENRVISEKGAM